MWICWMMDGRVSRERVNEAIGDAVLRWMRREWPAVLFWTCRDDDGLEWANG